jgi:hypothetical protein
MWGGLGAEACSRQLLRRAQPEVRLALAPGVYRKWRPSEQGEVGTSEV